MAIVNTTVSQSPAPVNTTVPNSELPTGTIYMFGCFDRPYQPHDLMFPLSSLEYYPTEAAALEQASKLVDSQCEPNPIDTKLKNCSIYQVCDEYDTLIYIHVWAVNPAGGAA